jgi:myo-inositol 2-dehydrogenase/D-chiro-inositol 1-dehydrogenase
MALRTGIVGAGRIGNLHAGNVARHARMEVAGVYDVDGGRAQALARQHGARAFDSLEALIDAVDAVVVGSSTDTHAAAALAVAAAGKPMYLEKPIDLDSRKALRTAAALRSAKAPIMLGFNRRFDASYRALREDVRSGALGRVQVVRMCSRGPNEAPPREYIEHCGGIYRDKGIHFLDLLRHLTGREAVEIYAQGGNFADAFIAELGDVDTCVMQVRLDDESMCQIDNARRAVYGFDERIEIFGTAGLREAGRPSSSMLSADESGLRGPPFHRGFMHRFEAAFAAAMDGFARCVLDGERDVPGVEDGVAAQVLAEAAARSAQQRKVVDVAALRRELES